MSNAKYYVGHSKSNKILIINLCLNNFFKFDIFVLKHKLKSLYARRFNG